MSANEEGTPFAENTKFTATMLVNACDRYGRPMKLKLSTGKTIRFCLLIPLYPEELKYRQEHDTDALVDLLAEIEGFDIVNSSRRNAITDRKKNRIKRTMKKTKQLICLLILVTGIALAGCGLSTFEFTRIFDNTTVEIHDAKAGEEAESNWFTVGKNQMAAIESSLEKGSVQMEFVEVDVISDSEWGDDVYPGDVKYTMTVNPGDQTSITLEPEDYILRLSVLEETNGTIKVNIEKKN